MARLGRSASAKPQLCSRTLLHLLRHFGTAMPSMMTQGKSCCSPPPTRSSNDLPVTAYGTFCPLIRRQLDADEPVPIGLFVTH
jgi:hypothetical protein